MSDDFYIGYQKKAPKSVTALIRRTMVLITLIVLPVAGMAAYFQQPADDGTFEFGVVREFPGILVESPFPHFVFAQDVEGTDFVAGDRAVLVGVGKHGASKLLEGATQSVVLLQGSLIYRDTVAMIEVVSIMDEDVNVDTSRILEATSVRYEPEAITVTGELVDTKCYLGVMRPGAGKVHRACASVCLRGGIPPGMLVRGDGGDAVWFLVDRNEGKPLSIDPEFAARRMTITGSATMLNNLPAFAVDSWQLTDEE